MSTFQATVKQSVSEDFANKLAKNVMRITRLKADAGDTTAHAIIKEAMEAMRA